MHFFPRRNALITPLFFASSFFLFSCVGKGKYLNALQSGAEASSEAASAKTDYRDAMLKVEQLQRRYVSLLDSLEEATVLQLTERSGNLDERQQLVKKVTLQALLIDSLQIERNRLHRQRLAALAAIDYQAARLQEVKSRVSEATAPLSASPLRMIRAGAALEILVPEAIVFTDKRTPSISPAGDAFLSAFAAALGGQPDLRIEVAAEPRDLSGSPAGRLEAGRRAALVVGNLVEGHGLDPGLVSATSLQVDPTMVAFAPAEASQTSSNQLRVTIRIGGDLVGAVRQALHD